MDRKAPRNGELKPGRGGARPGTGPKPEARHREVFEKLGPPPEDELEGIRWAYRYLLAALYQAGHDLRLTDKELRQEIRTTTRAMNQLIPKSRLRKAERALRGEVDRQKAETDPQLEAAPAEPEGKP